MIVFITSVRHPLNSTSYEKVEALLKRTLSSLCRQTNQDYKVIVACNKTPSYAVEFPNVDFLELDFPPPSKLNNSKIKKLDAFRDRGCKRLMALKKAQSYFPEYVMFFDADDLLSKEIAGYVNLNPGKNGFYVDKGFVYGEGMITIQPKSDFHQACGSSIILNFKLLQQIIGQAFELPLTSSMQDIIDTVDDFVLYQILGNHSKVKAYFNSQGCPISPLPFAAAVWIVNTGENRSVNKGLSTVSGILVTKDHRENFMLDAPSLTFRSVANYLSRFPGAVLISLRLLIFRDLLNKLRAGAKVFFGQT